MLGDYLQFSCRREVNEEGVKLLAGDLQLNAQALVKKNVRVTD